MLKKLRVEAGAYDFVRRAVLWLVLGTTAGGGYCRTFVKSCPGGGGGEFMIFVLTDPIFGLLFLPTLVLAFTSARAGEAYRYPMLLRYRTRAEALAVRLVARAIFVLFVVLSLVLILGVLGSRHPIGGGLYPEAESISGIVGCQVINITCFLFSMLVLREIFQRIFRNTALELFFTFLAPIANWMAVMKDMTGLVLWSPWGKIVYMPDYRFYWQYWLAVLAALLCAAVWLEMNRDYVFEQHRHSG